MALTAGTKLGPYEIQSPLGAGGMGEVYRARDTRLERTVAVKILPASVSSDPDRLLRFQHEARILSTLNHPNVLAIFDVGEQAGVQYLVSEFLEGQSLRDVLTAGTLSRRAATAYALEIAKGLAAAHEKGVLRGWPQRCRVRGMQIRRPFRCTAASSRRGGSMIFDSTICLVALSRTSCGL